MPFQRTTSPTYDPAIAPVSAAELQAVLYSDLAEAMRTGALAPGRNTGVSIGIFQRGVRRIFTYGTARPDSIFEIGSLTKTFTGLILSQMVEQGKVALDQPVRELLPLGTVAKPTGEEITLLDLVTHRSGLPRMPANYKPRNPDDPSSDYDAAKLYAFMAEQGVAKPENPPFLYSNLGFGLLGQALADQVGMTFENLLQEQVIVPLGLKDTAISLSAEQFSRFIPGHTANYHPVPVWLTNTAMAPCGGIRSTGSDILSYLEANLHPEKFAATHNLASQATKTLSKSLRQCHILRADVGPKTRMPLAWWYNAENETYGHGGVTAGYNCSAFFAPKEDTAVIVLMNTSATLKGSFADWIIQHIQQRLAGKSAISLVS